MLYVKDQFGNKLVLNPTFSMVGLPFQRKYETLEIPGSDGKLQTSESVMDTVTRTISGTLYGTDIEDVEEQRDKLGKFVSKGKIKIGYENANRYIEGQVVSFDHKYEAGRVLAEVRITVKCDNPYIFGEEIVKEYLVTPSNYGGRFELENPPAWLNFQPGTFDVVTGKRIADDPGWESSFISDSGYLKGDKKGDGFTFDVIGDFVLYGFDGSSTYPRILKWWIDDVYQGEETYAGGSGATIKYIEKSFEDGMEHTVTVVCSNTYTCWFDYIDIIPSNQLTSLNSGIDTYPSIEVESIDTVSRFSPLGKISGDGKHPFTMKVINIKDYKTINPSSDGVEWNQTGYNDVSLYDNISAGASVDTNGESRGIILEYNLLADQSPYKGLSATELQNNIQNIVSSVWACGGLFDQDNNSISFGTELYIYINETNSWAGLNKDHTNESPSKMEWGIDFAKTNYKPSRYINNEGKIYFLMKSKYPSDGVSLSKIILSYCDLEITFNYAKLGTDFIVNQANNLIENSDFSRELEGWGDAVSIGGSGWIIRDRKAILYCNNFHQWRGKYQSANVIPYKPIYVSADMYTNNESLKYEGAIRIREWEWDGEKWGLPKVTAYKYQSGKLELQYIPTSSKISLEFLTSRGNPKGTWVAFTNILLIQSDQLQYFQTQDKYTCGFSDEVILSKGDILILDPKSRNVEKNGVSLYPLINEDFKFNPLQLSDLNHIQFNNIGNVKYKIKYLPKWR